MWKPWTTTLATLLAVWLLAPAAQAVIIDSFDNSNYPGDLLAAPAMASFDDLAVAGVAGGDRRIDLTATAATSPVTNFVAFEISGGVGGYASGPTADGYVELLYDGASLAADLGGAPNMISLDFAMFDGAFNNPIMLSVTVSDGVDMASGDVSHFGSSFVPFTIDFDLLSFPGIGAVNLGGLTSILVRLDPDVGQDYELDAIRSTSSAPEPASVTMALFAIAAIGATVQHRKKRRKSGLSQRG